tara:strand:+ start:1046 stop:2146 length:1101 start_codon:yes stop_codon:yes gene_type:complete
MNILINCSNIKIGGGIQVSHSFLNQISSNKIDTFVIVLSNSLIKIIDKNKFGLNHHFENYNIQASSFNVIFSKDKFLDNLISLYSIDVVFTVFGPSYWKPAVPHVCGFAKPHYIYKSSPFFNEISFFNSCKLKIMEFFHLLDYRKNCDVIITENPDVTEKIGYILNKDSFTVTNNYNQIFDSHDSWEYLKLPNFDGKYMLTISANYPHKNLKIIPLVVKELISRNIQNIKFVVSLDKGQLETCDQIDEYIIYIGKVSIYQCPPLYQQVDYLFLPTLLECFSASYAEAMKMEKIILTSDLDFAKGICGNSAVYFNPLNEKDIVDKILEIDQNLAKQNLLIQNGLMRLKDFDTAEERANKYLDILKRT